MADAIRNTNGNIPMPFTDNIMYLHNARNRGDSDKVREIASNAPLSRSPEPKQVKPLVRYASAKEYRNDWEQVRPIHAPTARDFVDD
jgi:hypothetical protein